ncbi:MAG TPA: RNA-binding protein [Steroidobacteraceae bacterium]|jgi:RNA recognition motif-containing protein|nr:RNA-binding protein [Steroidobacteraceae bacterium]
MTKLYVGNLPFSANQETVRALFAEYGTVQSLSLVNDRETGTPRGFGFVEMATAEAANAMQGLDGKDFGGRPLKVHEAHERPRSGGPGRRR